MTMTTDRTPADPDAAATPPATRFLDRDGHRVAYDDTGVPAVADDGRAQPTIVAIPGMGDRRQVYRHLTPLLVAAGHRVVTMDLRGMGESSADWPARADYSDTAIASDVVALIDALDLDDVIVVGTSLGAAAAVLAAVDAPGRVRGLVLVGPFVRAVPMKWWQSAAFKALLAPPWGRKAWVGYYGSKLYPGPQPADLDGYVADLGRTMAEPGRMKALRALAANTHAESGAVLGDVSVPTVVVMGSADPDFPDPAAEAHTVAQATRGTVVMVDGSGHYPQADQPDVVAAAVQDLAGHPR